ncbi:hypothetical protein CRX72_12520 [Pantoea sp. BRM17]|nr:hypothetical protein CRX72_12520 [Pantoea sp. BRM17]
MFLKPGDRIPVSELNKGIVIQSGNDACIALADRPLAASSLLFIFPAVSQAVDAPAAPQIEAKAWVLMDYNSGKVLAESNADQRLDPASLTKMMTSYVVAAYTGPDRMLTWINIRKLN